MAELVKKYKLNPESIELVCEEIEGFYKTRRAEKKEYIRTRYLIEETLLNYRDKFGEDVEFEIRKSSRISKLSIQLLVYSEKFNPFKTDDEGLMSSLIAAGATQNPNWQYVKSEFEWLFNAHGVGRNEIVFDVPKQQLTSNPVRILIGLLVGIIAAFGLRLVLGAEAANAFSSAYIMPLANAYTGALSVMAILMIFFSLPLCIVQYNNATQFHNATRNTLKFYMGVTVILVIVAAAVATILYGVDSASVENGGVFSSIYNVIIGFVPNNLVTPFINFNCMQVLIIGLMFGFSCLAMGERSKPLVDVFDRVNLCAVLTNVFLAKFVSIYVALMMCSLILSSNLEMIEQYIGVIIAIIIGAVICVVLAALAVCLKFKISLRQVIKKFSPSFMINLSSANVGASYTDLFNELALGCGVDIGYTGMACNIGTNLFKPMYAVFFAGVALTAANLSGVMSLRLIVEIIFLSIVLPVTIPNIQGGAASVIVILISQLGLGNEYAEVFVSINAILQYIIVPVNIFCMQCLILVCAGREEKIDLEKLRN